LVLENFAFADTPSRHAVGRLLEILSGQADTFFVSHHKLSYETDIRLAVVRTLLTYLELDGLLQSTGSRYDTYRIRPLVTSRAILANFDGPRRDFLAGLLGQLTKARDWYTLNTVTAARHLREDRPRIIKAVDFMAAQNWIEVRVADLVHGYRWVRRIDQPKPLADDYFGRFSERQQSDLARLDAVFDLARGDRCLAAQLAAYFGQTLETPCGRCSHCIGEPPEQIPPAVPPPIGDGVRAAIDQLVREYPDHFTTARDRARFLCGFTSPRLSRSKLRRHPSFGVCQHIRYDHVLEQISGG